MSGNVDEHHEIVIVGGGTGGLFTARKLVEAGIEDVVVLESRGGLGGRVSTTRDSNGNPMFNNFAWRIGETNVMMLQLCKDLNLNLIKQTTPPPEDPHTGHGNCKHGVLSSMGCQPEEKRPILENRPPLSDFASACLRSASEADRQDRESGYAGRTGQVSRRDSLCPLTVQNLFFLYLANVPFSQKDLLA
jgi:phytoene dehydrogenase-like protein